MPDPRDELIGALVEAGRRLELPVTPSLAPAVTSRLLADRAAGSRPLLARRFTWTPRQAVLVATLLVIALLAIAAGARFAIGAAEIRVQPGPVAGPPLEPASLGDPEALEGIEGAVGFDLAVPDGRPPDVAYVSEADEGTTAVLAWRADERSPRLPGTPWGLILLETAVQDDILVKRVNAFEDTDEITLDGRRAFWVHAPHELLVITEDGDERFLVRGNVLIWEVEGVTYRLETPLGLEEALALARSVE